MGLVLVNPDELVRQADFEEVCQGALDSKAEPSTRYAAMFNEVTINNARKWLFHHPDDADLVPTQLHDPIDVEIESTVPDFRAADPKSPTDDAEDSQN